MNERCYKADLYSKYFIFLVFCFKVSSEYIVADY